MNTQTLPENPTPFISEAEHARKIMPFIQAIAEGKKIQRHAVTISQWVDASLHDLASFPLSEFRVARRRWFVAWCDSTPNVKPTAYTEDEEPKFNCPQCHAVPVEEIWKEDGKL